MITEIIRFEKCCLLTINDMLRFQMTTYSSTYRFTSNCNGIHPCMSSASGRSWNVKHCSSDGFGWFLLTCVWCFIKDRFDYVTSFCTYGSEIEREKLSVIWSNHCMKWWSISNNFLKMFLKRVCFEDQSLHYSSCSLTNQMHCTSSSFIPIVTQSEDIPVSRLGLTL